MPAFSYKAIGRDGKSREGVVEAAGPELASRQLRAQGLTLLELEAGTSQRNAVKRGIGKTPGRQEVLSFTTELAVLLRAGLPLDRALKVLIDMAADPQVKQLQEDLLKSVKGGKALSAALQDHEQVFGGFYINMVRSGEASGQLSAVLDRMVEYLENARANQIENAEFYAADAFELMAQYEGTDEIDLVVLDPPRTGHYEVARALLKLRPERILYVSCDPATLARDLSPLIDDGYEVVSAQPFDLFPQTWHIESMNLLRRLVAGD